MGIHNPTQFPDSGSNLTLIFRKHIPFPLYLNPLLWLQRFEKYDLKVLRRIMNPIDILEIF